MPSPPTVNVLLVEDDDVDVMAIERAFRARQLRHPLTVARDGRAALAVLRGEGGRRPLPRPYLIVLDLNLPVMTGLDFLRALRSDPAHRDAVVFVFTTSSCEHDRRAAYDQNVAGYVAKSEIGNDLGPVIDLLEAYFAIVSLPAGELSGR
jgi:CheY-like chemotaxis protein